MAETTAVRPGEELDIERLKEYLTSSGIVEETDIRVEQFPAGSSNLTYLIHLGDSEFVLRRPPFGNTVKSAHDMGREFRVLSKLSAVYPPAPKPLLFCDDEVVIGFEFYLMERRRGLILRGSMPPEHTYSGSLLSDDICRNFIQNLADLHALDYNAAGLGDLGKPEGYARRQVEGWSERYFAAKTDEHTELETAIAWITDNIPADSGASLVHNDYKFDNVMLDPNDLTKITAVLDWEMVTIGDPLMDLGTTLGYLISGDVGEEILNMTFNPRVLMENVTRSQLVEMYAASSGRDVSNILFYYVFGTFKIAVIAQQIYARFVRGSTKDQRFAGFDKFVSALGSIAQRAINTERSQVSDRYRLQTIRPVKRHTADLTAEHSGVVKLDSVVLKSLRRICDRFRCAKPHGDQAFTIHSVFDEPVRDGQRPLFRQCLGIPGSDLKMDLYSKRTDRPFIGKIIFDEFQCVIRCGFEFIGRADKGNGLFDLKAVSFDLVSVLRRRRNRSTQKKNHASSKILKSHNRKTPKAENLCACTLTPTLRRAASIATLHRNSSG